MNISCILAFQLAAFITPKSYYAGLSLHFQLNFWSDSKTSDFKVKGAEKHQWLINQAVGTT